MENLSWVLLIILLIGLLVAVSLYHASPAKTSNPLISSTATSTIPLAGNNVPGSTNSIVSQAANASSSCASADPSVLENQSKIYNGDFGTGTYAGWYLTGSGFGTRPFNLTNTNLNGTYYQSQWSNYIGGYFATTYTQKHGYEPGTIYTSFVVVEPYLNFRIISAKNPSLYVEIIQTASRQSRCITILQTQPRTATAA